MILDKRYTLFLTLFKVRDGLSTCPERSRRVITIQPTPIVAGKEL